MAQITRDERSIIEQEKSNEGRIVSVLSQDEQEQQMRLHAAAKEILANLPENTSRVLTRLTLYHEPGQYRLEWRDFTPGTLATMVTAAGTLKGAVRVTTNERGDNLIKYGQVASGVTSLTVRAGELEQWEARQDRHKPKPLVFKMRYTPKIKEIRS